MQSSQREWRNVFIIAAVIYFIGGTISVLFTSGELQEWAKSSPTKRKSLTGNNEELQNATTVELGKTSHSNSTSTKTISIPTVTDAVNNSDFLQCS